MSKNKFYHIDKTGQVNEVPNLNEALKKSTKEGYVWLSYSQPSLEELLLLSEPMGIHPLSIEDCLDNNQIPKIEEFEKNTYILFNAFNYFEKNLSIGEINFFLGEKFLITIDSMALFNSNHTNELEKKVKMEINTVKQGPAYLLHVIFDDIVDHKVTVIEALEEVLNNTEETMLDKLPRFNPVDLQRLRGNLGSMRKSLFHEREIFVKICRNDIKFIPHKAIIHYRDILDHLIKCFELTESFRDTVKSLIEMNLALLNFQMTKVASQTNLTIRRLTLIMTIFMPLSLLAGVGGMSEWSRQLESCISSIFYCNGSHGIYLLFYFKKT
jgi:magnesium transporter